MQIHRQRQRKSVDLVTAADETQMDSDQHTLCDFLCTKWIILPVSVDAYPWVGVYRRFTFAWLILSIAVPSLSSPDTRLDFPPVRLNPTEPPARLISAYRLFKDPKQQIPNDWVVPYDLNTPHFADYANLHRFIWLPKGKNITYYHDKLEFPIGAVIIITVGYLNDIRPDRRSASSESEQIIETRLLVHKKEGWTGLQYIWNQDTTDAHLSLLGGKVEVSWIHYDGKKRNHTYLMPNQNQCKQCHQINGNIIPLGPIKAQYLNKDFSYSKETDNFRSKSTAFSVENQLLHWARIGYLNGIPENIDEIPRIPVWNDPTTGTSEERARAYLDMNCSSCHQPNGLASTSGLDLMYAQKIPVRYGIFKAPVAAGRGAGDARFAIQPGRPESSMLLQRLVSTDPGVRMPIVSRSLVHEEGVALIEEWISQMEFSDMTRLQSTLDQRKAIHLEGLKD